MYLDTIKKIKNVLQHTVLKGNKDYMVLKTASPRIFMYMMMRCY